jgi:two-component system chemotaxis response regulator CheY
MLNPNELKLVLKTLSARRAWLSKRIEEEESEAAKAESMTTLKLLDSAMQKLSGKAPPSVKPAKPSKLQIPLAERGLTIANAKILIADDDEASAELMVTTVGSMGAKNIDVGSDGIQAFDKIKSAESPYDIILCDWDMPELTGLEVHQKAKASNTLRGAYFCMVTGVSDAKMIRAAIQQGVSDYIVKPIDATVLEGKLNNALGVK